MAEASSQLILETIVKGVDNVTGGLNKIVGKMSDATKASAIFTAGFAVIGTAAVVGIGKAIQKFGDFEAAMSGVKAASDASAEDMKKLTDLAAKMGAETKFTAVEAAEGMGFLAKAGFDTNEIMSSIPGVMNLAAAAQMDLGTAADMSAGILSGFNLEATEMGHVADVMAKAVNMSQISMDDMNESMKYMAPTANVMGISMEESSAAIAIFGENNLKGGIATRAFSSALARLSDPTDKIAEGMKNAGLQAFDTNGKFVGLKDMIAQLEVGMKGMTEEQRLATLSQIFGAEAFKNIAVLMDEGSEKLGDYTNELVNSQGAAEKMATTLMDNFPGAIEYLTGAFDSLVILIGSMFAGGLQTAVEGLTAFINKITETIPKIQELWKTSDAFRLGMIMVAGAIVGAMVPAITALGSAILFRLIPAFASAALALAPFMLAGAVIAGVVAGVYYLVTSWDEASAKISAAITAATTWITEQFTALGTALYGIWESIRAKFMEVWASIGVYVTYIAGIIGAMLIPAFVKMATQATISTAIVISQWVANGAAALASSIVTTVTAIPSIIAGFGRMVAAAVMAGTAFVAQWVLMGTQSLLQAARVAAAWLLAMGPVGWVMGIIGALAVFIYTHWDQIKAATETAWNAIGDFFSVIGGAISTAISVVVDFILGLWTSFVGNLEMLWSGAWNAMKAFVGGVVDGIVGTINKIIDVVSNVIGKIKELIGLSNEAGKSASKVGSGGSKGKQGSGKATGGGVFPGVTYPVGENGPEMFTPSTAGHITKNSSLGNGGVTMIFQIDTMIGSKEYVKQLGKAIVTDLGQSIAI